jgi:hypothetical protein
LVGILQHSCGSWLLQSGCEDAGSHEPTAVALCLYKG